MKRIRVELSPIEANAVLLAIHEAVDNGLWDRTDWISAADRARAKIDTELARVNKIEIGRRAK